ncbi:MAG: A/G-specific adenine glycosylase [Vicingus serpentipes]|nr:A/G-specific adenine glycosylase [Vicingus serpentipes]
MDFSKELINWYSDNKRDLPWRNTKNPYYIWLSEIILQQTKVDQGLSYYNKFVSHYPNISDLANAKEDEVLKLWQGLGYYSRARNLHFTAKEITNKYNAVFPNTYENIIGLKGVGEYTASAIASFSYGLVYPVIDGNVYRVLSRLFGIETPIDTNKGKVIFKNLAQELINKKDPATYNQAIMEFGALQCKPKNPNCETCPFLLECAGFQNKNISNLPLKSKKTKQRNRFFNYLVIEENNTILLNKRTKKDIWEGLFDFPLLETKKQVKELKHLPLSSLSKDISEKNITIKNISSEYKHILSHQKIHAIFWHIKTNQHSLLKANYTVANIQNINKYPVPKLIDNYLKTIL